MLENVGDPVCKNKNILVLLILFVYISGLCSVLYGNLLIAAFIATILFIICVIKNTFPVRYIVVLCIIFYTGIFNTSARLKTNDFLLFLSPADVEISGQIISVPKAQNNNTKFFMKVDEVDYNGKTKSLDNEKILVSLKSADKFKIYDYYKIQGRISVPFEAGNPSQFDYSKYLQNYGTYTVLYGKNFKDKNNFICSQKIEKQVSTIQKIIQKIGDYRDNIITIHSKYMASPNAEILGGIVFGDDAVSPPENIKQSFTDSGLLHILAASGMNVAFIFSFFFFFLNLLKANYKFNIIICSTAIILYMFMTGLGPSIVRAGLMLIFVLFGKLINRDADSIALLSFVAFIMLIYNPLFINNVSFQLSFITTLGLLLTIPRIVQSKNRILNWIIGIISIPIIAQIWVLPLQIFYFNNICLYSVFANIMSVPFLSVISFGGFISSLTSIITPFSEFICKYTDVILNPLISLIVNISDFWGNLPGSSIQTTHPHIIQVFCYYLLVINVTLLIDKDLRDKIFGFSRISIPLMLTLLITFSINIPNHNLEITAFEVGNADSFLIKTPENKYIIIDTGKSGYKSDITQADMILIKYLKDIGIKDIETLILTHFDNDHSGGAVSIIENLNVKQIYVNSLNNTSENAKNIYKTAEEKKCKLIKTLNNSIIYNNDGLTLTNYISDDKEFDDNESSIITLLKYGKFTMLFTGDAGLRTYYKLKDFLPHNITVLKVGHHGADGVINKKFAEFFNPQISLISTGSNSFGHPSPFTIQILKNSKILRTDKLHSIRFKVNKDKWNAYTYNIKKHRYTKL